MRRIICTIALTCLTLAPSLSFALTNFHNQIAQIDCTDPEAQGSPQCQGQNQNNSPTTQPTTQNNPTGNNNGINVTPGSNGINTTPGSNGVNTTPDSNGINTTPGGNGINGTPGVPNPFAGHNINNLCDLLNTILNYVAEIGALIAVIFIIWSGFLFVFAQGNKSKIEQAKKTFYTTIIGAILVIGSSVIAKIIVNTVGSVSNSFTGSTSGGICS